MNSVFTRATAVALASAFALLGCSGGGGDNGSSGDGGGSGLAAAAAGNGPSVCNQTNAKVHVAVAYRTANPDGWTSEGWTDVAPGKCAAVLPGRQAH